jgi:hypothetical protein
MQNLSTEKILGVINEKAQKEFPEFYKDARIIETKKNIEEMFNAKIAKCTYTAGEMNAYMG